MNEPPPLVIILCRNVSPSNIYGDFPPTTHHFDPRQTRSYSIADSSTGMLTRRGKRTSKAFTYERSKKSSQEGVEKTKLPSTLPPAQLLPLPLPPLLPNSLPLSLLPPPLPLPPPSLSTKSNVFASGSPYPESCQREGCSLTVHHVCQNVWEDTHNWPLKLIVKYCPHHHHGTAVALCPPIMEQQYAELNQHNLH